MPESKAVPARPPHTPSRSLGPTLDRLGVTLAVTRPSCFRGDDRLRCRESACRWRKECRRLVAEWRR